MAENHTSTSEMPLNTKDSSSAPMKKKYAIGDDFDIKDVFTFPFIVQDDTVNYIQKHGKVMFLIRGPPSTCKAGLSDLLQDTYPKASFCSADSYFKIHSAVTRNRETLKLSHKFCMKNAEKACENGTKIIIVQNTHMRKWEMQGYLDLASTHLYTVIMAITLYRFDVTPERLLANSNDGLDLQYFQNRLRQWEDIPPYLTGWFVAPNDTLHLHSLAKDALEELLHDGKFCRVYNFYDISQITQFFKFRSMLCCLAGFSENKTEMLKYYLSDKVQEYYGQCYTLTILGYYVSTTVVNVIVRVDDAMKDLLQGKRCNNTYDINFGLGELAFNNNFSNYFKTASYAQIELPQESTTTTEDWETDQGQIGSSEVSFIHLAQREDEPKVEIGKIRTEFNNALKEGPISDDMYSELENGTKVCRLANDTWIVRAKEKIVIRAVFSGLYL